MRITTLPASTAALAVAALLLAGCGSDNSVSDSRPSEDDSSETGSAAGTEETDENDDAESGEDQEQSPEVPEGWVVIDDGPSGIAVAMPQEVEPQEQQAPTADGGTMDTRSYFVVEEDLEVGFNVLDLAGGTYDLEAGMEGTAQALEGEIQSSETLSINGYDAIEAELSFGDDLMSVFQLILVDDNVLQPMVSTDASNRERAEEYFDQITGSLDLG